MNCLQYTPVRPLIAFDFDSTLVSVESFDLLADHALKTQVAGDDRKNIDERLHEITHRAMNGEMAMDDAIRERFSLVRIHRNHVQEIAIDVTKTITSGMINLLNDLRTRDCDVILLSGGILDLIIPTATMLGFDASTIFANTLVYDADDCMRGYQDHPLCKSDGKEKVLRALKEKQKPSCIIMIGDGMTDALPWQHGVADAFIGCGIHVLRPSVANIAPSIARTMHELSSHLTKLLL